jgi:hypothetical protein
MLYLPVGVGRHYSSSIDVSLRKPTEFPLSQCCIFDLALLQEKKDRLGFPSLNQILHKLLMEAKLSAVSSDGLAFCPL